MFNFKNLFFKRKFFKKLGFRTEIKLLAALTVYLTWNFLGFLSYEICPFIILPATMVFVIELTLFRSCKKA